MISILASLFLEHTVVKHSAQDKEKSIRDLQYRRVSVVRGDTTRTASTTGLLVLQSPPVDERSCTEDSVPCLDQVDQ